MSKGYIAGMQSDAPLMRGFAPSFDHLPMPVFQYVRQEIDTGKKRSQHPHAQQ